MDVTLCNLFDHLNYLNLNNANTHSSVSPCQNPFQNKILKHLRNISQIEFFPFNFGSTKKTDHEKTDV